MGLANQQRRIEERLCWLGGIIDGEGMVTAVARMGRNSFAPRVSIVNTDETIINEVVSVVRELGVPFYVQTKSYRNKSGTSGVKYEVIFGGMKRCLKALPILIPYLVGKRHRAEKLLEWCQYRIGKPMEKYTENDWVLLDAIRQTPRFRPETTRATPVDLAIAG